MAVAIFHKNNSAQVFASLFLWHSLTLFVPHQTLYILKINARKIFVPVWRGWALGGANYVGSVSIIQQTLLTTNLGDIDIDILKHIYVDIHIYLNNHSLFLKIRLED